MYRLFNAYPICHVNDSSFDKIEASLTYFLLLKTCFYLQILYSWLNSVHFTKDTYLQWKSQFRYLSKIRFQIFSSFFFDNIQFSVSSTLQKQNAVLVVKAVHCLSNLSYTDGSGLVKIEDSLTFSAFEFLSLMIVKNFYASIVIRQLSLWVNSLCLFY